VEIDAIRAALINRRIQVLLQGVENETTNNSYRSFCDGFHEIQAECTADITAIRARSSAAAAVEIDAIRAASKRRIQEVQRELDAPLKAWMARTSATRNPLKGTENETTNTPEDFSTGGETFNKPPDEEKLEEISATNTPENFNTGGEVNWPTF